MIGHTVARVESVSKSLVYIPASLENMDDNSRKTCSFKEILQQYQSEFQTKTAMQFDAEKVIQQFIDPASCFWNKVLADHYLTGLLFGYGEENIKHFVDRIKKQERASQFSDEFDPSATSAKFPIPVFAVSAGEKTTSRYRKQKKRIQKEYRDKDIVEITLHRLVN
jgi:hypothetical protein